MFIPTPQYTKTLLTLFLWTMISSFKAQLWDGYDGRSCSKKARRWGIVIFPTIVWNFFVFISSRIDNANKFFSRIFLCVRDILNSSSIEIYVGVFLSWSRRLYLLEFDVGNVGCVLGWDEAPWMVTFPCHVVTPHSSLGLFMVTTITTLSQEVTTLE